MAISLWNLIVLFATLAVFVLIAVPFSGVLIRFRANYNPKSLHLDAEGGAQAHVGPIINSYFGMMKRVYDLEGPSGLYKGLMPTLISTLAVALIMLPVLDAPRPTRYRAPPESVFATFIYSIAMMTISLPTTILTCRSVTTPHKLGYFDVRKAVRVLFTSTERRKPWILYLTPGLFLTEVLHIIYVVFILGTARRFLIPNEDDDSYSAFKTAFYVALLVFSVSVLTPLEVVAIRLAIQRNHGQDQPLEEEEDNVEYAGAEEDVIGLRSEEDPYLGLSDAVQRIIHEEGFRALYRGWWLTLLAGGSQAFV